MKNYNRHFENKFNDLEHNLSRILIRLKGVLDLKFELLTRGLENFSASLPSFRKKLWLRKKKLSFWKKFRAFV